MNTNTTITYAGTDYTKSTLGKMSGKDLVKFHNDLAAKAGKSPTNRFATIGAGLTRTWALLEQLGDDAKPAPAGPSASMGSATAAKPAKAKKAPKAAKVAEPKADDVILEAAKKPASVRPGLNDAIYDVAKAAGPTKREDLVAKILAEVTPPRSQYYNREYVLGYLAHGVRQGYLKVK